MENVHCRHWYDVLHTPSTHSREAWKRTKLTVSLSKYPDQEDQLAGSWKASVLPVIIIDDGTKTMVESILQAVYDKHVKELALNINGIPSTVDVALLSHAVVKVEKLWINGVETQTGQTGHREAILGAVIEEGPDLALKSLYLGPKVFQVSPDLLASAAVKLDTLEFDNSTSDQIGEILTRLSSTENSKLRVLDLGYENVIISHLSTETLIDGLLKLESISRMIQRIILSDEQMTHFLNKMRDLEYLSLVHVILYQLDPDVLAGAVTRIETLEMSGLTRVQIQSIFTKIHLGGCKLKKLELEAQDHSDNDFSLVSPEVLLGAFRKMEKIWIDYGGFTTAQADAIDNMVTARSQGSLKHLKIYQPIIDGDFLSMDNSEEEEEDDMMNTFDFHF